MHVEAAGKGLNEGLVEHPGEIQVHREMVGAALVKRPAREGERILDDGGEASGFSISRRGPGRRRAWGRSVEQRGSLPEPRADLRHMPPEVDALEEPVHGGNVRAKRKLGRAGTRRESGPSREPSVPAKDLESGFRPGWDRQRDLAGRGRKREPVGRELRIHDQ